MLTDAALAGLDLRAFLYHRQSYLTARLRFFDHCFYGTHKEADVLFTQDFTSATFLGHEATQYLVDGLLVAANGQCNFGHW